MRYRRRTWEIDVVQWNGDNRSEIEELAGKSIGKYEEAMAGEIDYLPPAGWYAVKDRGRFLIWSPAVLNQEFEPIHEELSKDETLDTSCRVASHFWTDRLSPVALRNIPGIGGGSG